MNLILPAFVLIGIRQNIRVLDLEQIGDIIGTTQHILMFIYCTTLTAFNGVLSLIVFENGKVCFAYNILNVTI